MILDWSYSYHANSMRQLEQKALVNWNRFKADVGETSERRGGAHVGFSERIDPILN